MKSGTLAGTWRLFRLYVTSKRVTVLLLVLLPLLFAYGAGASNMALLSTPKQLTTYITQNQGNALLGEIQADSVAGATIWRIRTSAVIISGVLSVSLVLSLTRREEGLGRAELVRALSVGPRAPLTAALALAFAANLLGGLFLALGFLLCGFPAAGSLTAGMAMGLSCCALCAVPAIAAQLAPGAAPARSVAYGALALFLFIQIAANSTDNTNLLLCTPMGWCALARPFAGENCFALLFAAAADALLTYAAYALFARRDLNGSYFRERPGRPVAARGLNSAFSLTWRLQRSMLLLWVAAYAIMGLMLRSLTPAIQRMLDGTSFLPQLAERVGGAGNAFLVLLAYILTQVLTAYALLSILRLREEETAYRAELMLSTPVSRKAYALTHIVMAYAGSFFALLLFGLCMGNAAGVLSRLPAVWLLSSVAMLLCGFAPRRAIPASWGVFGALLLLEFLWELKLIPPGLFLLSPFAWVYPGAAILPLPLLLMLVLAAALLLIGLSRYSRRDMTGE